ncbi:unnamed protein product [Phaeothamnion confervicola]
MHYHRESREPSTRYEEAVLGTLLLQRPEKQGEETRERVAKISEATRGIGDTMPSSTSSTHQSLSQHHANGLSWASQVHIVRTSPRASERLRRSARKLQSAESLADVFFPAALLSASDYADPAAPEEEAFAQKKQDREDAVDASNTGNALAPLVPTDAEIDRWTVCKGRGADGERQALVLRGAPGTWKHHNAASYAFLLMGQCPWRDIILGAFPVADAPIHTHAFDYLDAADLVATSLVSRDLHPAMHLLFERETAALARRFGSGVGAVDFSASFGHGNGHGTNGHGSGFSGAGKRPGPAATPAAAAAAAAAKVASAAGPLQQPELLHLRTRTRKLSLFWGTPERAVEASLHASALRVHGSTSYVYACCARLSLRDNLVADLTPLCEPWRVDISHELASLAPPAGNAGSGGGGGGGGEDGSSFCRFFSLPPAAAPLLAARLKRAAAADDDAAVPRLRMAVALLNCAAERGDHVFVMQSSA